LWEKQRSVAPIDTLQGELQEKVLAAVKKRGFRSEQAFLIAACEHELREGDNTEATAQLEARIAATLANMAKEVQALFTLGHTQFALTNSLLQYVLTCMIEPPQDVLPAARARARLRYTRILRLAAQEVSINEERGSRPGPFRPRKGDGNVLSTSLIEESLRVVYISHRVDYRCHRR
jgi:hypothetical protein